MDNFIQFLFVLSKRGLFKEWQMNAASDEDDDDMKYMSQANKVAQEYEEYFPL